jgi:hypothetical protein
MYCVDVFYVYVILVFSHRPSDKRVSQDITVSYSTGVKHIVSLRFRAVNENPIGHGF